MDQHWRAQKPFRRKPSAISAEAAVAAIFLAAMLQWAAVLAVCPSLHELIHHDSDDEHHNCAVTLFLSGQVEQAFVDPLVVRQPVPVELLLRLTWAAAVVGSFFLSCHILEHGPPLPK
jgi:hypothetical protein